MTSDFFWWLLKVYFSGITCYETEKLIDNCRFKGAVLGLLWKERAVNLDIGNPGSAHCLQMGSCSFALGTYSQRMSSPPGFVGARSGPGELHIVTPRPALLSCWAAPSSSDLLTDRNTSTRGSGLAHTDQIEAGFDLSTSPLVPTLVKIWSG